MTTMFMFCAVIGGTILVCQFVLMLVGLGGDHSGFESHDGDAGHALESAGHDVDSPDGHDADGHHGSTWLFSIISVRTLIAATTFFGIGGLLAESFEARPLLQLISGTLMGFAAMVSVHKLMGLMHRLSEDGTVKIRRAIGLNGTVYVPIPPNKAGAGKVHLNLQSRLVEYAAVTANGEKLTTGSPIVVVDVLGDDILEVAPAEQPVEQNAA